MTSTRNSSLSGEEVGEALGSVDWRAPRPPLHLPLPRPLPRPRPRPRLPREPALDLGSLATTEALRLRAMEKSCRRKKARRTCVHEKSPSRMDVSIYKRE